MLQVQGFAKLRLTFVMSWGDIVSVVGFSTDLAYSLYSRFQFGVGRSLRRTAVVSRLSPPNGRKRKSCDASHAFLDGSTVPDQSKDWFGNFGGWPFHPFFGRRFWKPRDA